MLVRIAAISGSVAPLVLAVPLELSARSDNGVSGDANTASLSCGSQYISCCTDDSSVCNLAKGWNGDLGQSFSESFFHTPYKQTLIVFA